MGRLIATTLLALMLAAMASAQDAEGVEYRTGPAVRFTTVDVYLDSGDRALGAYQFELSDSTGRAKIVGLEGGQADAFKQPPYYDPAALSKNRVIVAAFSTAKELPKGKTRIARIHMQVTGDATPEYTMKLHTAAAADGTKIKAKITLDQGEQE